MRPSRVLLQARRPLSLPKNPPLRRYVYFCFYYSYEWTGHD